MLYDNAMLAIAYVMPIARISGRFSQIARRTLDYVLREMTDEKGGFYCAQDADSDGEEGKYYTFTPIEIKNILGQRTERFSAGASVLPKREFCGKKHPEPIGYQ